MRRLTIILIYLFAFFVPLEYIYVVFLGADSVLKPYRVFGILAIVCSFLFIVRRGSLKFDKLDLVFLFIFASGFLTALVKYYFFYLGDIALTYNDSQLIVIGFLMSLVIKNVGLSQREIVRVLLSYFIAVLLNAVQIINEALIMHSFQRVSGFFKNPNQAAQALVVGILFLIYLISIQSSRKKWPFFLFIPVGLALFFTGSRASILSLGVALGVWYFLSKGRSIYRVVAIAILLVSAGLTIDFASQNLDISRLSTRFDMEAIESSGGSGRTDIWESGLNLAADHFYLGVGMSQYRAYHHEYIRKVENPYYITLFYDLGLHSDYVSMLVEFGIFGLLGYLYILLSLLRMLVNTLKVNFGMAMFFLMTLVTIFIQGIFQQSYFLPTYWLMLGLALAFVRSTRRDFVQLGKV